MRVLIVGSGGREHALAWKLGSEASVSEVVCAPGNAGIAQCARLVDVAPGDPHALAALAERERVDLTVCGPFEGPEASADEAAGRGYRASLPQNEPHPEALRSRARGLPRALLIA